jgi:hypothetical protein
VLDIDPANKFYSEVLGLAVAMDSEIDDLEFARAVGIPVRKCRKIGGARLHLQTTYRI